MNFLRITPAKEKIFKINLNAVFLNSSFLLSNAISLKINFFLWKDEDDFCNRF